MKLFQVSLPRTRSTLLFESTREWQKQTENLLLIEGHPEFFLELGRNMELVNRKKEKCHTTELYPLANEKGINTHYVWPHILKTTEARNKHKIDLLRKERELGREYLIKGTLNMAESCEVIFDFFKDRKIILTTRDDKEKMMMSFFFSWESKLFHARNENINLYKDKMREGVTVPIKLIYDYIPFVKQFNKIENYLITSGINHEVVTYEELEKEDKISELVGTDEWKKYNNENSVPIHIEKDYKKLIHNYDEVLEILKQEHML